MGPIRAGCPFRSAEWLDLAAGSRYGWTGPTGGFFNVQLEAHDHPGLVYEWRLIDGERHSGTRAESDNRGVRFAFAPLAPAE